MSRSASIGQQKSLFFTYKSLFRYFRNNENFARHDYNCFLNVLNVLKKYLGQKKLEDIKLLDLGCGQRYPITLLSHSVGLNIVGVDTDVVNIDKTFAGYFQMIYRNGIERFFKTLIRQLFFDQSYYDVLGDFLKKEYNVNLNQDEVDIREMSAIKLEFADNSFDAIYSNAVFEHIDDVVSAMDEVARVIKTDGIVYLRIHLYPSISGGHVLGWANPDMQKSEIVPVWDHLRENQYPTHVYLNKLTEKDYLQIFSKHFEILEQKDEYEGKELLTEKIKKELSQYSAEELLKRSISIVLKKK